MLDNGHQTRCCLLIFSDKTQRPFSDVVFCSFSAVGTLFSKKRASYFSRRSFVIKNTEKLDKCQ
ncbi:conserved protein of unknown function [Listeria monocytogenes]|nr:predicted protein [Listeria monocytogenes HPB2262]GAM93845.1 conserved protein of unknown function [Listeria monocytogenes]GAM96336.1 conserved protein of unknown function [Listeria monocytogenes]